MKISGLEKLLLGLTAGVLLFCGGYYLGSGSGAEPYEVTVQHREMAEASPSPAPSAGQPQEKININTATNAELQVLPGIGEKRATDIIADRTANGPFRIVEDLTRVKGIGEGTLAQLIDYITVD